MQIKTTPFSRRTADTSRCAALEQHLLTTLSGGSAQEISIVQLLGKEEKAADITYTEGYGRINETEDIIAGIYRNKLPLDSCIIACTNTSAYSQVIYDIAMLHGIPVTFGCGVPIANSNPARLLKMIFQWDTAGFNGIDALARILTDDSFNRAAFSEELGLEERISTIEMGDITDMAGALRISFEGTENEQQKKHAGTVRLSYSKRPLECEEPSQAG